MDDIGAQGREGAIMVRGFTNVRVLVLGGKGMDYLLEVYLKRRGTCLEIYLKIDQTQTYF